MRQNNMSFRVDLKDREFGRLTVLSYAGNKKWLCRCSCPLQTEKAIHRDSLYSGHTQSCGCFNKERIKETKTTHGLKNTREYITWINIKSRCYNKNNPKYKDYGERGITVCERWLNSFENFFEDMKECPPGKSSIDRKNNDGNYCKENCEWADDEQQANNTRRNHYLTYDGVTLTLSQWSRKLNILVSTLHARIRRGWSTEDVLTQPIRKINYEK